MTSSVDKSMFYNNVGVGGGGGAVCVCVRARVCERKCLCFHLKGSLLGIAEIRALVIIVVKLEAKITYWSFEVLIE